MSEPKMFAPDRHEVNRAFWEQPNLTMPLEQSSSLITRCQTIADMKHRRYNAVRSMLTAELTMKNARAAAVKSEGDNDLFHEAAISYVKADRAHFRAQKVIWEVDDLLPKMVAGLITDVKENH